VIEPDLGRAALVSLVIIAAVSTLIALAVFRKFTDAEALRRATNRIVAHLLECFLFLAEPRLVFRAQGELIRANLRFLRIIALPLAILILPFWFLFAQLEANFGQAPLPLGVPSVLTVHLAGEAPTAELKAPPEIVIETPAVRDVFAKEINWRIRPLRTTSGPVRITLPGRTLQASVRAGHRIVATIVNPFTRPAIDRHYPRATVLNHDWVTWYIATSALTALLWWRYAS
jgi:hypothetical protein